MNDTSDLGSHILTIAMVVFYLAMLHSWLRSPPGSGGAKQADTAFLPQANAPSTGSLSPSPARELALDFDRGAFLKGAIEVYELVLRAYGEGNIEMLKRYVGPAVMETFKRAIAERFAMRRTMELTFVGMDTATIVSAVTQGGTDQVTVRFLADVVSVTRLQDGVVVAGDPREIVQVADSWTFTREARLASPNWHLTATDGW
jgi:predicted lipid-binding transport protein (Tim44 family)